MDFANNWLLDSLAGVVVATKRDTCKKLVVLLPIGVAPTFLGTSRRSARSVTNSAAISIESPVLVPDVSAKLAAASESASIDTNVGAKFASLSSSSSADELLKTSTDSNSIASSMITSAASTSLLVMALSTRASRLNGGADGAVEGALAGTVGDEPLGVAEPEVGNTEGVPEVPESVVVGASDGALLGSCELVDGLVGAFVFEGPGVGTVGNPGVGTLDGPDDGAALGPVLLLTSS